MIQLTKEQTYNLILYNLEHNRKFNFAFVTKMRWYCLRCTTPIYVDYKKTTRKTDIYCAECCEEEINGDRSRVKKNIQLRFIQQIEIQKLKMFDKIFEKINNI